MGSFLQENYARGEWYKIKSNYQTLKKTHKQYTSNQVDNRFPHKWSDLLRGWFRELKFRHSTSDPEARNHNFFAILQSLLFANSRPRTNRNQSIVLHRASGNAIDCEPVTLSEPFGDPITEKMSRSLARSSSLPPQTEDVSITTAMPIAFPGKSSKSGPARFPRRRHKKKAPVRRTRPR